MSKLIPANYGESLICFCGAAVDDIVLIAPFMQSEVVARIMSHVGTGVSITCVTRWRPEDIISGVSDPDVWLELTSIPTARLFVHYNLHAKYYRADYDCLLGSANLTKAALGWSRVPNLEIMMYAEFDSALEVFEGDVIGGAIPVDRSMYEAAKVLHATTGRLDDDYGVAEDDGNEVGESRLSFESWLPSTRNPAVLYQVYIGELDSVSSQAKATAQFDLAVLQVPAGLPVASFERSIAVLLLQHPLIRRIDLSVQKPRRFGEMKAMVQDLWGNYYGDLDPTREWQTLMRWLLYFLPDRYIRTVYRYTEVFALNPKYVDNSH